MTEIDEIMVQSDDERRCKSEGQWIPIPVELYDHLRAALEDSRRLDALEDEISNGGPITMHHGEGGGGFRGLGLSNTGRTLRVAIDQCCGLDAERQAP